MTPNWPQADAREKARQAVAATRCSIAFAQDVPTIDSEKIGVFRERAPARIRVLQQIAYQQSAHFAFAVVNGPGVINHAYLPTKNHGVERGMVVGDVRDIIR